MSVNCPTNSNDPVGPDWYAAEAAGHDMLLLLESAELTPDERLRLHGLAVARLERLELAMGRSRQDDRPPA